MGDSNLSLLQKQILFARLIPKLLAKADELGLDYTFGEAERPEVTARYYASLGKGIKNSVHRIKLAVDLNLYRNGLWLKETHDHAQLGAYWKTLHPLCRWGGDFGDGNHYSIFHEGRA